MAENSTGTAESTPSRLRDASEGRESLRTAVAVGRVEIDDQILQAIKEDRVPKGDVVNTARVASLMGAKQTTRLIPHCLDVQLRGIDVDLDLEDDPPAVSIRTYAKSGGPTGVEMEALTAVSIAALTIYDMCKSISKNIQITGVHLVAKTGGHSGDYLRESRPSID